ncbi:MAG: hypothetical protein KDA05_08175, partial [Phycisphaerales bacterium]|nr:hypothetical protein [Phycisphaerales bacterium]
MEGRLSERAGETGAARDDAESGGGATNAGGSPALDAMLRQVRDEVPAVLRACGAPWATMAVRLAGRTATWVWNAQDSGGDADVLARQEAFVR